MVRYCPGLGLRASTVHGDVLPQFVKVFSLRHGSFLHSVPDRSPGTLLPIIQQFVLPGTTIRSDEWFSYFILGTQGYIHETVNHSEKFTKVHTQNIESQWGIVEKRLRRGQTTNPELLETHLILLENEEQRKPVDVLL